MKNYYDNFRRLICDVKNPSLDRRKRYGAESIELLKEGTALYEFTHADDKYSPGSVFWYRGDSSGSVYTTRGFGEALIQNSVVCEPQTWRERVRLLTGGIHSEGIIDQLIASGIVTPEQVAQAAINKDKE